MPAHCTLWHSEYDHGQSHGFPQYGRNIDKTPYQCAIRGEVNGQLWTFVTCPSEDNVDNYCEHCGGDEHVVHKDAIIIAVDGACRGNGTAYAQSGYGVFFHKNSGFNRAIKVPTHQHHSNQRAELLAGLEALLLAKQIQAQNPRKGTPSYLLPPPGPTRKLRRVVIMADSRYLVDAMTRWIFKWKSNGYLNAKGEGVLNQDLFQRLERAVEDLNKLNVNVQFWHVRREDNGVADALASAALDGRRVEEAVGKWFR